MLNLRFNACTLHVYKLSNTAIALKNFKRIQRKYTMAKETWHTILEVLYYSGMTDLIAGPAVAY